MVDRKSKIMANLQEAQALLQPHRSREEQLAGCDVLAQLSSDEATDLLEETLKTTDPVVMGRAARVLVEKNPDGACKGLLDVLGKEDSWGVLHLEAVECLGEMGRQCAEDALFMLVNLVQTHHWSRVREAAARALNNFPSEVAAEALIGRLAEDEYAVRCAAAESLGRQVEYEPVLDALIKYLPAEDRWGSLQLAIVNSLKQSNDPRAINALTHLLTQKENISTITDAILSALTTMGKASAVFLLSVLSQVDRQTQQAISDALRTSGEPELADIFPAILYDDPSADILLKKAVAAGDIRPVSVLVEWIEVLRQKGGAYHAATAKKLEQMLEEIYKLTLPRANTYLCSRDLARFTKFQNQKVTWHGCRKCQKTWFFEKATQVIAVLDETAPAREWRDNETLVINVLKQENLFDFDQVETGQVSDEEMVRFCIRVSNDSDLGRNLGKAKCVIGADSKFEEGTLRVINKCWSDK